MHEAERVIAKDREKADDFTLDAAGPDGPVPLPALVVLQQNHDEEDGRHTQNTTCLAV
jgi:hypothetical protein